MHCGSCCLELSMTKTRTVPKHYREDVYLLGWEQKECPGSGEKDFIPRVKRCRRRRSEMRCPACGRSEAGRADQKAQRRAGQRMPRIPR